MGTGRFTNLQAASWGQRALKEPGDPLEDRVKAFQDFEGRFKQRCPAQPGIPQTGSTPDIAREMARDFSAAWARATAEADEAYEAVIAVAGDAVSGDANGKSLDKAATAARPRLLDAQLVRLALVRELPERLRAVKETLDGVEAELEADITKASATVEQSLREAGLGPEDDPRYSLSADAAERRFRYKVNDSAPVRAASEALTNLKSYKHDLDGQLANCPRMEAAAAALVVETGQFLGVF